MALVEHQGKRVVPLHINGQAPPLAPERLIPVTSAATDAVVHYAQAASLADARAAVDAAVAAWPAWRATTHAARRDMLHRAIGLLDARADAIAATQVLETSCAPAFAAFLPRLARSSLAEIAASITAALTGSVVPLEDSGVGMVLRDPVGPVLCIPPWNSPTILGLRGIASALAAGCPVVLKASELCPATYAQLAALFTDAGLPPGCLNVVQADRAAAPALVDALVAHPGIRKVEFIGSAAVGRAIGQLAAAHLKPVLMELGGKSPALVLDDADLPRAAAACAFGATLHHGQICFSTERIIVTRAVAKAFEAHLVDAFARAAAVPPPGGHGGAASRALAAHAHDLLADARAAGARFVAGDNSYTSPASLAPTVVADVPAAARLRDEETFGPSASLYVVDDADAAVALANDTAYGLSASVWTADALAAVGIARRLEVGQVHVNSATVADAAALPISGLKGSGWGDNNAQWGIGEFLVNKTVVLHSSEEIGSFGR